MGRLRDKIVLITGAAGGIGLAIGEAVVRAGGIVVATDVPGKPGMDHALDVTSDDDWVRVITEVGAAHHRLDGLVNAAGIAPMGTVEGTDYAMWRKVIAVNLDGTFLGCKHGMSLLKKQGGSIINISSVSGLVGGHNLAAYNASKGGVRLLSKSVALHGARQQPQVRCNSVHPTFIEGPMSDALFKVVPNPAETKRKMEKQIPLHRFGKPAEVADMCVYLLSDESGFVTGAEFVIDGGLTAQ
ncbi:MAG: 3(or 17)beta-hydroxysteroid dehydrogenase [Variibacter sp.]|jgi:NAD(P)-dependent dehydrogenase (short-subunit alcohol dehydrogenase family)|nr:3(or 17)beta-hydroxysteroid dehydrogenase [Variibacter sp.]